MIPFRFRRSARRSAFRPALRPGAAYQGAATAGAECLEDRTLLGAYIVDSLSDAVADCRHLFSQNDTTLDVRDLDASVIADSRRFHQVLCNLLGNAAKFAPAGSTVRLAATRHDGRVRFTVEDDGPGIAAKDRDQIFNRFYQGAGGDHTGSGLGLSICRAFVNGMNGTIEADSSAPRGARFHVDLPEQQ